MNTINQKENVKYPLFGVMWRFSAIILVPLLIAIYFTYMPVKWLFTGVFGFTKSADKKAYEHIFYLWIKKTGL